VVGRLSAAIAHEINNPLLPIKINLEHMAEDLREGIPIDVNDVEETRRSAERIHRIVDRLLKFTRKGQQSESSMELINLGSIIEHVVALSRKYCEHQGVQVVNQVTDLPLIYGNRDQLQQVFLNLVLNAVAAITESGTVRLTGYYEGDYVTVDVADDGCGIPSDMLKEIFEPFVSSKQDGSGLGLFISYEIIKNHQGQISVVSQVDTGTTFTVRIPVPDIDEIDQD
jgi:signal transduction histidine kinase